MAALSLDIFSDVICPWCFIGKRRMERAMADRPQDSIGVRWRAFLLNPDMPEDGMERQAYLSAKFGTGARSRDLYAAIEDVGATLGIPFAFDRIRRTPNTVKAHRLIAAVGGDDQDALVEALFRAYFLEGVDLSADDALVEVAAGTGLDKAEARAALDGEAGDKGVYADNALAHAMGIGGVPCFILNGRYAIAGAQEPEVFHRLFDGVRAIEAETA
jgi:predicted DsbA family dithiol-disulfide isomerase